MKILVTGANGYIGSRVILALTKYPVEVIATDVSASHLPSGVRFIEANIFEEKEDWYSFFGKPDVCLHLAWRDGFVHNSPRNMEDLSHHFAFIRNMLDNGLPQIASMGSMHEVGYHEGAITEDTPCRPSSLYGIAKDALRRATALYAAEKKAVFQWLRGYYIYGDDTYGSSIFCKLRKAAAEGKTLFPFTTGKNKYDFIHIDTLADYIAKCILQTEVTGIINVSSGTPVSLADMVEKYIADNALPIRLEYGKFPDRPYDSPVTYGDSSKLKQILEK